MPVYICENITLENEKITSSTLEKVVEQSFGSLMRNGYQANRLVNSAVELEWQRTGLIRLLESQTRASTKATRFQVQQKKKSESSLYLKHA